MSRDSERLMREARDAAERANQHKSEFLSSVSHEIRTPLSTVVGVAELLAETTLDDRQRRYVKTLQRASDHLLALIDEVLDLSRIEAGSVSLENVRFDVHDVSESAIDIVRESARRKKLDIGWAVAPDVPRMMRADARRIRQVLVNLLSNAVKFTPSGRIALGVACDGTADDRASIHFTVRDSGIGIRADRLSAIFGGFVQGDGTIASRYGGYGLGLDIAKRIIERMGGTIWVESEVGRGSCFHVALTLPIERSDSRPSFSDAIHEQTAGLRLLAANGGPVNVLVVDDSEDTRALLAEFLQRAGARVELADDSASALAKAATLTFDVVLMDLQMPSMDGFATTRELLRSARVEGRTAPIVIALSAHALQTTLARCLEAGCTTQLTKPIRKRVLLEAVAHAIGGSVAEGHGRSDLAALLPQFLNNRRTDLLTIADALDHENFDVVATLAHNMRGNGASFGFPELSAIGDALETAARGRHMEAARVLHAQLVSTVNEISKPGPKRTESGTRARVEPARGPTGTNED